MTDFLESCKGQRMGAFSDHVFAPADTRERWPPERTFQLQHMRLDLTIDDEAKTVSGTATHRLAAINDGLKEVAFDQEGLDIRGVKDDSGKALEFEVHGEQLLVHLPRLVVKDTAVDAVCHGANVHVPGVAKLSPHIRRGQIVGVLTGKDEAVALAKAMMTSDEIVVAKRGVAADVARVLMNPGTYPKLWK